jgi:8-oxo-dGTP pyrophosphatase MutT (NUDIX family)
MQLGPLGHYDFTVEELRRLAAERLEQDIHPSAHDLRRPSGRGDHDLNPGVTLRPLRSAAVLLGIVERAGEARVVLTQRTEELPTHAGQISLPGGKVDDADPGPVEAALRESREEIGLEDDLVRVIGMLDTYQTGTGYRILPVVGLVSDAFEPRPEPREVAEVFEVPLAFLMNSDNHQRHSREWQGARRYFYAMPYQHRYIWGATAGILRNLYDRVYR